MTSAASDSPADAAYLKFVEILDGKKLFSTEDNLSEADTRSKLIDPLFKHVLGWHESEIRREPSCSKGYADYVFGSETSYLIVEAKRASPRFHLSAPNKSRRLLLSGPHLLGNKKLKPFVEQAQSYASDFGVPVCMLSNGSQLIAFRAFTTGKPWRNGTAIVFHDRTDIKENFAEFFELFSRDAVISGSLIEAFDRAERQPARLFTPIETVSSPNQELLRNRFWQRIARTMGPLLSDTNDDPQSQLDVIQHCYVTNPLSDQTDQNLDELLRDTPQGFLTDASFIDLKTGAGGKTAFSHKLADDVYAARKGAYILTGGVGSGKTTFLKRFATIVEREFVDKYTAWIHIDFLPIGNVDPSTVDRATQAFVYKSIRTQIIKKYATELTGDGEAIRRLFEHEIDESRLTRLYGVSPDSDEWRTSVNQLVTSLFNDDERFAFAALRYVRRRGQRIAIVLDNTDQLGEKFQETVFLLAQKLSTDYHAICVVTLREEKFFAAHRRGIFDAFGDKRFHIGSPDLKVVLRRRLEYGREMFKKSSNGDLTPDELVAIDTLLRALINSTTDKNANIVRMLASVSNGDMRYALDMFKEFLSSGNTNVEKIIEIVSSSGSYIVPFHEFAKSAILGSRRFYRSEFSKIANLFKQSGAIGASHLAACRILSRLVNAHGAASEHGEGFVSVKTLLHEYRESFGYADDFVQWASELLRRGLIEAEPPRVSDVREADAIKVSAAGAYYWHYLIRAFAYLDLVFIDTPIADQGVAKTLATMADLSDMNVRFERVRAFLAYMEKCERDELQLVTQRGGVFKEALIPQIRDQVEAELRVVAKRTKVRDQFGRD